jgi:hypothetical protein
LAKRTLGPYSTSSYSKIRDHSSATQQAMESWLRPWTLIPAAEPFNYLDPA